MLVVAANLLMAKQLELELKRESKDLLFITFQQMNPLAKEPCMSRKVVILYHLSVKSC